MFLTTADREVLLYSQSIGQLLEEVEVVVDELKGGSSGTLAISVTTTASHFATRLLADFSQRYENVTISPDITNRKSLKDSLRITYRIWLLWSKLQRG